MMPFMMKQQIAGIVFDLDGVLVNSEPLHLKAWEETVLAHGVKMKKNWFSGAMGVPDFKTVKDICGWYDLGVSPDQLLHEKRSIVEARASEIVDQYEGVKELVAELSCLPIAVATSSCRKVAVELLKGAGILDYIPTIISSDDVIKTKPSPECYIKACRSLNLSPEKCIAVEDSAVGIDAAKSAGLSVLAVCTSYKRDALMKADACFEEPREALQWIADQIKETREEVCINPM